MVSIDVDWEVWKAITTLRETEAMTPNEVLRNQFKLPLAHRPKAEAKAEPSKGWYYSGVTFPEGTEFQANFGGKVHQMRIQDGKLMLNGRQVYSPSEAAQKVCGYARNGWFFWQFRMPGQSAWQLLDQSRRSELRPEDVA